MVVVEKKVRLFVLDRGFVTIGESEVSNELIFTWKVKGSTVRVWGTSDGLAELVNGPLNDTILEPVVVRYIPFRAVIEIIEVNQEKWEIFFLT